MAYLLKCSPCCKKRESNGPPVHYRRPRDGQEEDIVMLHPQYAAMLRENHHELREIVQTADLWPCFKKYGVMDKATERRIKV